MKLEYELKCIEALFRVVTPCFIGASDEDAALRLPAIKGLLRFWWRALAYAGCTGEGGSNHAIRCMRRKEDELFGSSEAGQSQVLMRLDVTYPPRVLGKGEVLRGAGSREAGSGARYLGYGVTAGKLIRPCLAAPFEFTVRVGAKDKDAESLCRVEPALRLLGLAGGIGARARKGYGSLNLISLEGDGVKGWRPPETIDDYRDQLTSLLETTAVCNHEPEISAFSSQARVALLFENCTPLEVLDDYGKAMVRYRSWGRNGKILNGERSQCRFPEDHNWSKGTRTANDFHPRRAVFGLPHNYGKQIEVRPQNHGRRASPLLFHVQQIGKRYAGIAFLLRSRFLPEGERISAHGRVVPSNPNWSVLTNFLDENSKRGIWPDA